MLTNCPGCDQIVEVSALSKHLKTECVNKHKYKTCKRCRESIPIEDFEEHDKA